MAREKIIVGFDVGSSKISTLIATSSEETLTVIGVSTVTSKGIRKGQVVDIDEAVSSIAESLEAAERMGGVSVSSCFISVGGAHISSVNSRGVVAVAGGENEIGEDDVRRVIEAAQAISVPSSREIIHVIPRDYIVDSQEGVKDPVGMTGVRLEVETHIITGAATAIRNLVKCVQQVGIDVDGLVFSGIASAESVLTDTEKELGVALVDIGGGTTDVALFVDGSIAHSVVIPIGGRNITNDLAIGLRSSLETAEKIKLALSEKERRLSEEEKENSISKVGKKEDTLDISKLEIGEDIGTLSRKTLTEGIIKPRLTEISTLIGMEIKRAGFAGLLPAGLVITGGAASTMLLSQVGKDVLRMPVRVAEPRGVIGLIDEISSPAYSTAVGLLLYGEKISVVAPRIGVGLPHGRGLVELVKKLVTKLRGLLP
ncbi:MAG: cell division protein FtsA [Candidatus Woykebacteria bacterium RBG_16_44_10]|uniref:Cell division protein FtsA n=1 Tax=Candidatus Woykebacteria bacterium RBG_16_44_10 TaxID=1802597 RepID=A0A1G1WES7_9BACT|nr:MAG: cell division protein FtsA [Candidatus Woykebacteria bacterium RBG_16_44_10]